MKKLICILFICSLLLCSCGGQETPSTEETTIEIDYDIISRRNNRTVLMDKYNYVREVTRYYNTTQTVADWAMEYSSDNEDNVNIKFLYGGENLYYYNNNIYLQLNNEEALRSIIPFKSSYQTKLSETLKRDNTLNYVYYKQTSGKETEDGYAVSYWFTVTSDVLDEFVYWDIHIGDTIKVDYNINKDCEILDYTYYIVKNPYSNSPQFTKIMQSQTTFDIPFKMPDFIYECDSRKRVTLTIKENYQKSSQIVEDFTIPAGVKIWGDENLIYSKAYIDDNLTQEWNFEEDIVTKSMSLYTIPDTFIEYVY